MSNFFKSKYFGHSLTAIIGCLTGVLYEKSNYYNQNLIFHATSLSNYKEPTLINSDLKKINSNQVDLIMKYGFPNFENVKSYNNFVVCYDKKNRNANWVFEHLNKSKLREANGERANRKNMVFFEDKTIHPYFRSTNDDFLGSGYDRGHLAAAGNNPYSYESMNQTFILSNISPQVGIGFNRGVWNELEVYTRFRANRSKNTWVCTGPLYLPKKEKDGKNYVKYEVIGANNVAVPTHFFKILLIENNDETFEMECFLIENKKMDKEVHIKEFLVPLDVIERAAGFLIFDKLPKNRLKRVDGTSKLLNEFKFIKRNFNKKEELKALPIPAA